MKRYKQIDAIKGIVVLLVAMYHFWVVGSYKSKGIEVFNTFLSYGGERGGTLFFILSGFGIYIWHLVIANNLYHNSPIIKKIANKGYWEVVLGMLIITVGAGYFYERCFKT